MSKLSIKQIEEFFNTHLPYRNQVLIAHKKLCAKGPYHGDPAILSACFEASLVTGRMYLNVLGIRKNRKGQLEPNQFRPDDISTCRVGKIQFFAHAVRFAFYTKLFNLRVQQVAHPTAALKPTEINHELD